MKNRNKKETVVETAYFGGGCFWCIEAIFRKIKGVTEATPGYAGGNKENPTYEEVSSGKTGHAEVVKVEFDPTIVSFEELLTVFFYSHNPGTLNQQGSDIGKQYRSVVFYANKKQKTVAEKFVARLRDEKAYDKPIVTEIRPLEAFYKAENYHQKYFEKNPDKAYCQIVIAPKIEKIKKTFDRLYVE